MFETSNIETIPAYDTMIEHLIYCAPFDYKEHKFGKSIVQPKNVKCCQGPHFFFMKDGFHTVDVKKGQVFDGLQLHEVCHDQIRINHY